MPKKSTLLLENVCQQISLDEAAKLLGWAKPTLQSFMSRQQRDQDEWRWLKGVVYFQTSEMGAIVFNRYMLSMWQIAKSQNDPGIYLNAISRFQEVVRGN
ncbi:hypothetical protein NIES2135_32230 [Leptolyngbya boryana NIES-2135]|jgi:outer membrane protein assembly factor BamD (BamD/ComL family)|uniref:Uncharacterized protein n=1 Tax=Leptolyngbya boryana NIES-2135 TaxID=1973484 RepID=A0A1Z4JI06_LEPBY|nr:MULTISPECIES: hypothetical protein [Leptolyngbya]BAY56392.1 hypothetical protein NIES2135_32230 [Leptolyngbya boryana NIES-2135]MBD2366498.1 hypothetical protein [Leptolyngbya sp. FACHB-161]MBD2372677.1 hypothetical protein [Leptolyngbya sp. FACHB-238]MBD2397100.1 hypothetical protein [Leptolyngbya sp. FACHB-239]MBD2403624.1 hypothetical protein [Leptolyngbya sp. FACHB-402]